MRDVLRRSIANATQRVYTHLKAPNRWLRASLAELSRELDRTLTERLSTPGCMALVRMGEYGYAVPSLPAFLDRSAVRVDAEADDQDAVIKRLQPNIE